LLEYRESAAWAAEAKAAGEHKELRIGARIEDPRPSGSGIEIDISRVWRIAIGWSLGRLSGRPMRPASAIVDLQDSRALPARVRAAGV
jgi:hypothetical protein